MSDRREKPLPPSEAIRDHAVWRDPDSGEWQWELYESDGRGGGRIVASGTALSMPAAQSDVRKARKARRERSVP